MRNWLPIETAPKDGTEIDLWVVFPHGGVRWTDSRWLEPKYHKCSGSADWCNKELWPLHAFTEKPKATHWMPKPETPVSPKSAAAMALENVAKQLRDAGATLPAPAMTGTIEGAMITGLCIALCLVQDELEKQ